MGYTTEALSESTNGKPIAVSDSSTNIHTWDSGVEKVTIKAVNVSGSPATLTVAIGAVGTTGEIIAHQIPIEPNKAQVPITFGETITGTVTITAVSDVPGAINITGEVLRKS